MPRQANLNRIMYTPMRQVDLNYLTHRLDQLSRYEARAPHAGNESFNLVDMLSSSNIRLQHKVKRLNIVLAKKNRVEMNLLVCYHQIFEVNIEDWC